MNPDRLDAFDVEAACSDVRGHQHIDLLVLEAAAAESGHQWETAPPSPPLTPPSLPAVGPGPAYRSASSRCAWERSPCSSPTRSPMSPKRMWRRWACFLVWVKSITWSGKVRISRAGEKRRNAHQEPRPSPHLNLPPPPPPAAPPCPPPATMASRSPSRLGRMRMNSWRKNGATSVLLFTKIRTGFLRETEAKSFTCPEQRGSVRPAPPQGPGARQREGPAAGPTAPSAPCPLLLPAPPARAPPPTWWPRRAWSGGAWRRAE